MKTLHASYIDSFIKFAEASLEKSIYFSEIVPFANGLNKKANQLLIRASLNKKIELEKLQSVLFETGREYVRKFAFKFGQKKIIGIVGESL